MPLPNTIAKYFKRKSRAILANVLALAGLCALVAFPMTERLNWPQRADRIVVAVLLLASVAPFVCPVAARFRRIVQAIGIAAIFACIYVAFFQRAADLAALDDGAQVRLVGRVGGRIRVSPRDNGRTGVFTLKDWTGEVRCATRTGPPPAGTWALVMGRKFTYPASSVLVVVDFRLSSFARKEDLPMSPAQITHELIVWTLDATAAGEKVDAVSSLEIEDETDSRISRVLSSTWIMATQAGEFPDHPHFTTRRYGALGSAVVLRLTGTPEQVAAAVDELRLSGFQIARGDEPMQQHESGEKG